MEMKQWRNVIVYDKYENVFKNLGKRYLVNQYGEIYSLRSNKILKHNVQKTGYHSVRLYYGSRNKKYDKLVHNVVAWSFPDICGEYSPGLQINHKDENTHNNVAENLEWCTGSYNSMYGNHISNILETRKKKNSDRREMPVLQIKDGIVVKRWKSMIEAHKSFNGYDTGSISRCCNGKQNQHKGFQWKFA